MEIMSFKPLELVKRSWNYSEYRQLVAELAENNKTTGIEQTEQHRLATKLNAQRMKRIDRQCVLNWDVVKVMHRIKQRWVWLLIVESWCGDGAQNLPVIAKVAAASPNVELKIILRDENPEIMNQYLTNGTRSIPVLVCIDAVTGEPIGKWGPRPAFIISMIKDFKAKNPNVSHDEFITELHSWYAKDKGETLQQEFCKLVEEWMHHYDKI